MRKTILMGILTLALASCAIYANAQAAPPPPDTLKVDYFAYANTGGVPDGTVRLTNPGTAGPLVCAAIYVFNPLEEITECCSCSLTQNDLRTLSVNTDLTSNPVIATAIDLTTGSISIVSTAPANNECPLPTALSPVSGGVRAWVTHMDVQKLGATKGHVGTVAASQDATLTSAEQNYLANACYAIDLYGSGTGICTCGTGY